MQRSSFKIKLMIKMVGNKIKNSINGMRTVFSNRNYVILFIVMLAIFSFLYIFAWNLVLLPNFYIRSNLWAVPNILFLVIISILSGLAITLSVFNLKMKIGTYKKQHGYFAVIPAFFTSACPGCAPLLLSFTSATFAIGLSIAQFGLIVKILTILLLSATTLYVSSIICKCKIKGEK